MQKIIGYFREVSNELFHKVTWPSWSELQNSAIVVMVASFIIALIIYIMDFSFAQIMEFVYGLFK
ncbi:MAG: preprotein translocase subunit SecE [Salinivirgaceae bacterium]|nr:preprotein translocase subunit SecE [Salinivirgaceae bacterium]